MNKLLTLTLMSAVMLSTVSCASRENISPMPSIPENAKAQIERPINCNTASRDIKILEDEKATVGKQILSGVRSVLPVAAVAGILMGDYSDRVAVAVATGQYNEDITNKINKIRQTCFGRR